MFNFIHFIYLFFKFCLFHYFIGKFSFSKSDVLYAFRRYKCVDCRSQQWIRKASTSSWAAFLKTCRIKHRQWKQFREGCVLAACIFKTRECGGNWETQTLCPDKFRWLLFIWLKAGGSFRHFFWMCTTLFGSSLVHSGKNTKYYSLISTSFCVQI